MDERDPTLPRTIIDEELPGVLNWALEGLDRLTTNQEFTGWVGPDAAREAWESWDDPEDHEYRVSVVDGVPTVCECPADRYHDEVCKHRVAVAIRRPVLAAAVER